MIRQYQNKLSYNQARYTALKQDFENLENKYADINAFSLKNKINLMENIPDQIIHQLNEEHSREKEILTERIEKFEKVYKDLEIENETLLERLSLHTANNEDREIIVNSWKEENLRLTQKLRDQECLADLMAGKSSQVEFLQGQLDQRIRNFHETERQRKEGEQKLGEVIQKLTEQQDNMDKLHHAIIEKNNVLSEKEQVIRENQDHIARLEFQAGEFKQQQEFFDAVIGDTRDRNLKMEQQPEDEKNRTAYAEEKLLMNRQLMSRLFNEFSSLMEGNNEEKSDVSMRQEYIQHQQIL